MTTTEITEVLLEAKIMVGFNEIRIGTYSLPSSVGGFVYYSMLKKYYIVINNNLSEIQQNKVLLHEIEHIAEFKNTGSYCLELDGGEYRRIELNADYFMEMATELFYKREII